MTRGPRLFDLSDERGVLRVSIAVTLAISALGIGFGIASGSFSIVFDGVYSLVDASMSLLSLVVVNLIASYALAGPGSRKLRERFSMGFWHLEPMVLGLNATLLIGVAVYALVNAVGILLEGGRDLEFGWAIAYAVVTVIACAGIAIVEAPDLKRHVDTVAQGFVAKHGLLSYRAYVARVGRSKSIELYFIVPPEAPARTIAGWDALRDEIGALIGGEGPDRWLTVVFTGDREWAE